MAAAVSLPASSPEFSLVYWTPQTPERELRAAFRRPRTWMLPGLPGLENSYATVLANLQGSFAPPQSVSPTVIRAAITTGLPRDAFNRLKDLIGVSGEELSAVVRIPPRTVARRERFKPEESERILRVAAVFQRAIEVLGSLDTARRWFTAPKRALGHQTPMQFSDTQPGAEEVSRLLGRLEHGVFA